MVRGNLDDVFWFWKLKRDFIGDNVNFGILVCVKFFGGFGMLVLCDMNWRIVFFILK